MIGRWAQRFATAIERPVVAYGAALGAVALAGALREAAGLVLDPPPNFMIFYPAVLFATLVAGLRGGLFATVASALAVWALWMPVPDYSQLVMFLATAFATVLIAKAVRLAVMRGAAAEERFRIFQEHGLDAFVILEAVVERGEVVDFTWVYANPAAEKMAPEGVVGLTGRRVRDAFPGETGAETVRRFIAVMADGGPDDIEVRRTIDGQPRILHSSAVRAEGGVAVSFRDVTAQREAEAAATRGRDQFRSIANAAPVLIWMSGADQRASWFNDSWLAFTGRTLDQEQGRGWLEDVHPDDREGLLATYAKHFAGREPGRMEYRIRRHDGQYRWLDEAAAPAFDGQGEFQGYVGSCVDVTDRRLAETALRAGEARIRALVDSLPQLLWSNRVDGFCDYLSPQWTTFTGVPAEQHRGDGWLQAVHPQDQDTVQQAWAQAVKGGLPFDVEYRIRRHDGVWRWFNGRASAVREDDGTIRRWFGSSSDITEIVEARSDLEARVIERTRELQESLEERARAEAALAQAQRLETVGRLTGGVAHDFNNLLTVVIGGLDLILRHPDDTARVRRLAEAALAAGRRGERLTRQLLVFSRRQELKLEVVDLHDLIEQVEPLVRRAIDEGVELTIRREPGVGMSRLDPAQFEAALLNLVVNAVDATSGRPGAAVEVSTARVTLSEGEVVGASPGDHIRLSVADTGAGMTPEILERAFEPFFTTKEVGKGTGLGLAQVYGFVKQAGGAVTLESEPGRGAVVSLYLPAAEPGARSEPVADPLVETRWAHGARVLLVEDDSAVRTVTEDLLAELGCRVESEADGPAALARLAGAERFDLLISDIIMPGGMSGADLARAAHARLPDLPIILTTGYAGDRLDEATDPSSWPVLRKPFRAEQLAAAVRDALGGVKTRV
ncbi:PAS domain-containing protein [Phenylobacterium sp.]|uniref:PAS domain-containing protein n=1 Tax=Phenylobacterium sp. TaxID=1871053 RepID=UPI002735F157|nr:PAS domain-containing protein [Phenylobacterium sp.]MDP3854562.1 PAS domain-containing protein [Phenylobacterium sp.]